MPPPASPVLDYPIAGEEIYMGFLRLYLHSTFLSGTKGLRFKIEIAADFAFTSIVKTFDQTTDPFYWSEPSFQQDQVARYDAQKDDFLSNGTYYWRAWAYDVDLSLWSTNPSSVEDFIIATDPTFAIGFDFDKSKVNMVNNVGLYFYHPQDAVEFKITRRLMDYPSTSLDGLLIVEGSPSIINFEDTGAEEKEFNYYRIFWKLLDGNWQEPDSFERDLLKVRLEPFFDWATKLYNRLPAIYRIKDVEQEPALPLERFLRLIGFSLQKIRALEEHYILALDPFKSDSDLLEFLSWQIGWLMNKDLPILRRRVEIARAIEVYKRKGTKAGIRTLIAGLTNWDVDIITPKDNILVTNLSTSTTFDIDPDVRANMGTSKDTVDYIFGGRYQPSNVIIKLKAEDDLSLFNAIQKKLYRIFSQFLPACVNLVLDLQTFNEAKIYFWGWRPPNPDALVNNWLLTNSIPITPNPNQFEVYGARVTNSRLWLTPPT